VPFWKSKSFWAAIAAGALNLALQLSGYQNATIARLLWVVFAIALIQWLFRHELTQKSWNSCRVWVMHVPIITSVTTFLLSGAVVGLLGGLLVWLIVKNQCPEIRNRAQNLHDLLIRKHLQIRQPRKLRRLSQSLKRSRQKVRGLFGAALQIPHLNRLRQLKHSHKSSQSRPRRLLTRQFLQREMHIVVLRKRLLWPC